MAKKDKPGEISADYYKTLRARFAGKPVRGEAPLIAEAPADPASAWFGAQNAEDEAPAARSFDASSLRPAADALAARIQRRGDAELALGAYGTRLGIGAIWLVIAAFLLSVSSGVDSALLGRLFLLIAAAGIGAALLGAIFTTLVTRPGTKRIRADSASFGATIAREAQALSDNLDMDTNTGLTGIEADMFLRHVRFADDSEQARDDFGTYLSNGEPTASKPGRAGALLIAALAIAAGISALIAPMLGIPLPTLASAYPLAFAAIVSGVVVYAGAGIMAAGFGNGARERREAQIKADALDSVQAAFTTAQAPSIESLTARLRPEQRQPAAQSLTPTPTQGEQPASLSAVNVESQNHSQPHSGTDLDWRMRDSGPQFVDTGFQAAPKTFRVDAGVKKNHKKNR